MNERNPDDSCEPVFNFLVRNGCVKGRTIEELDAMIRLKFRDLRCSK